MSKKMISIMLAVATLASTSVFAADCEQASKAAEDAGQAADDAYDTFLTAQDESRAADADYNYCVAQPGWDCTQEQKDMLDKGKAAADAFGDYAQKDEAAYNAEQAALTAC